MGEAVQCRHRGQGPCDSGPTYRIVYRDPQVRGAEQPFCFAHAVAEVDRSRRAGSGAIATLESIRVDGGQDDGDCCRGIHDPLTGDPRGLHTLDCPTYVRFMLALKAQHDALRQRPPGRRDAVEPTAAEVQHLADVLTDARLAGVQAGVQTLARIVLAAGYRRVAVDQRSNADPEYAHLMMRRPSRELRLAVDEALMSPADTLTPSQQRLLALYFDMTCGNCIDGRCHSPTPSEPCGCARHDVSVHWRYPTPAAPQDRPRRPGGPDDAH